MCLALSRPLLPLAPKDQGTVSLLPSPLSPLSVEEEEEEEEDYYYDGDDDDDDDDDVYDDGCGFVLPRLRRFTRLPSLLPPEEEDDFALPSPLSPLPPSLLVDEDGAARTRRLVHKYNMLFGRHMVWEDWMAEDSDDDEGGTDSPCPLVNAG